MIYLDNAATTRIDDAVFGAMQPFLGDFYGNAGSLHSVGREAFDAVRKAREQVAWFINALPEQIIFTSGGTEANNMVINNASLEEYRRKIVTSAVEHDSILKSAKHAIEYGLANSFWKIPVTLTGIIDLEYAQKLILNNKNAPFISLASFMHTNNELGSTNPIEEIGELCSDLSIPFHTDCVQAAGFSEIDVEKFKCDFLTLSSHKIHGPKGVGCLYVRNPDKFHPLVFGGDSQEFGLRGGTENVAGIVGFGKACEIAKDELEYTRLFILKCAEMFVKHLIEELKCYNLENILHFNVGDVNRKVLNFYFEGIRSEALIMLLDSYGVCVSAGSACNASDGKPSHVLKAIGLTDDEARSSIRVSFSKYNEISEVIEATKIMANCVEVLYEQP